MKLTKTTLDKLKVGEECIFKNDRGELVHAEKRGEGLCLPIYRIGHCRICFTNNERRVFKIEDN